MDGISAGASILAFVATAVQTSQTIYQIVSAIKSRSEDVLNLVSTASSLERVLHQLSALVASRSRVNPSQNLIPLEQLMRKCVSDLHAICEKLWKLGQDSSDGSTKRAWKLVKFAFKRDEIQKMSRAIQQHVSILTLQVGILSRYPTLSPHFD